MSFFQEISPEVSLQRKGRLLSSSNPMPFLIEKKLAVSVGHGLFVLRGPLVALLNKIESAFLAIAREVAAEELSVPSLLSLENTLSSEYLKSFWNQAVILRKNADAVGPELGAGAVLGTTCSAACHHFFAALRNDTISAPRLATLVARCSRVEAGGLEDLSRLSNFTMREIVGVGPTTYAEEVIGRVRAQVLALYDEVFDLSYSVVTASDPFFGPNQELKKKAQLLAQSKHEIIATLPHDPKGLAISSFNRHGDVFYHRFQIECSQADRTSFCVAFGYERILFAILAQKGTDFESAYYRDLFAR